MAIVAEICQGGCQVRVILCRQIVVYDYQATEEARASAAIVLN